ncbi:MULTISPECIES: efflux RND transporter periplasmic adaptor subunit [Acinetobacter calcoaceticus/baumannii complex]|uniref:Efflux RND transporter periplasmic adaptor subunit n=2 Tax=Acinetobacter calcoaceticus/baumannii complex TaxID=909768 RepID=A0A7S8WEV7_ACIBA|nr:MULTISPECIES: efflux RND transporter periplasmic adaptor subunit [Acinetobacter calcoaceticus/baumannii complex]EHU1705192.1 efflux RND transporter periplasmic adaptor subunit [Acinetobacter baumannii]EXB79915.1 efflux transporter, RND family, MFP subunit [Acinetobacter baumannii 299505]KQF18843.1 hemolysin D [Acinetobacter baumannii]MBD0657270.1 efflux RND transporter periplasmic adaptor subunit [Acinetobacter baumannii]MCO1642455.1 efflux RND transporter periplasmic adaptor subunit [Acine
MLRNKLAFAMAGLVGVSLAVGGGAGYWFAHKSEKTQSDSTQKTAKVLYWYDPMKPEQHFDKPGKSPFMDMQLVPKYADEGDAGATESTVVKIDPSIQQNLAIRYAMVEQAMVGSNLLTNGILQANERQVAILQTRANGFVQRAYGHAVGDIVSQGSPIADVSIPEWTGEQTEFLAVLRMGDRSLIQASRQRLQLLGIPQDVIQRVERTRKVQSTMTLSAPVSGFIDSLEVRSGMALSMGQTLATIKGFNPIWLEAAVPEAQIATIKQGSKAEVTLAAYTKTVTGKVIDILPTLDTTSRTIKVRIELPNSDGHLKPGMFASVKFLNNPQASLVIPEQAVIRTGTRNVVIVAHEQGRFEPVVVQLGQSDGLKVAILQGLKVGQKVVISGQFLIDSEANLQGVLDKLNTGKAISTSQTQNPKPSLYQGIGRVEKVTLQEITISHQAIAGLGWGAMTMSFKQPAKPFTQIRSGDQVSFSFKQVSDAYVISNISKISNNMSMASMPSEKGDPS